MRETRGAGQRLTGAAGYQGVRRIAVEGHPAVILGVAGLLAALPSVPWGARSTIRNGALSVLLAGAMIYPDHLATRITSLKEGGGAKQGAEGE